MSVLTESLFFPLLVLSDSGKGGRSKIIATLQRLGYLLVLSDSGKGGISKIIATLQRLGNPSARNERNQIRFCSRHASNLNDSAVVFCVKGDVAFRLRLLFGLVGHEEGQCKRLTSLDMISMWSTVKVNGLSSDWSACVAQLA